MGDLLAGMTNEGCPGGQPPGPALAEQPHPDQAVAWGGSGIYRLRWPGIRILYEVDEDAATVYVINVAVTV
jgi:hypothetical protein